MRLKDISRSKDIWQQHFKLILKLATINKSFPIFDVQTEGGFHLIVESGSHLHWFCIRTLYDWLELELLFHYVILCYATLRYVTLCCVTSQPISNRTYTKTEVIAWLLLTLIIKTAAKVNVNYSRFPIRDFSCLLQINIFYSCGPIR